MIYGVKELKEKGRNSGKPEEATGVEVENTDLLINQMNSIILEYIAPRTVPQVVIKSIPGFKLGPVILIRIKRSATGPHAVWMDKKALFYIRSSNSSDPMDVDEIRMSFTMAKTLTENMRDFRQERISKIISGNTPVPLIESPKLVMHFLPYEAFDPTTKKNYTEKFATDYYELRPYPCGSLEPRYNFDGFLVYCSKHGSHKSVAYSQCFEEGNIEMVVTDFIQTNGSKFIHNGFDVNLMRSAMNSMKRIISIGINAPVIIFISVLGVRGFSIDMGPAYGNEHHPIEHNNLLLSEVIVKDLNESETDFLKTPIDTIWRACGYPRNMRLDEDGRRIN